MSSWQKWGGKPSQRLTCFRWGAELGYFIWKGWVKLFEVLTLSGNTFAASRSMPNGARCSLFMEAFECQKWHSFLCLEGLSPPWSHQGKTGICFGRRCLWAQAVEHWWPFGPHPQECPASHHHVSAWQSIRYRAGEWREVSKLAGNLCLEKWDSYS